ncbi:MAG: hypothetical protein ACTHKX_12840, partial [Pseudolysinimonas sp.]
MGATFAIAVPAAASPTTIEGDITGPASLAGIPVYLSQDVTGSPTGALFPSAAPAATTDAAGHYAISGVPQGLYVVVADAGDDWVQDFVLVAVDGIADPVGNDIDLEPGVLITGTVRSAADPLVTLDQVAVAALSQTSGGFFFDFLTFDVDVSASLTGPDGTYRIVVPLDDSYQVVASDMRATPLYGDQSFDHRNGCGCVFDPVVIPDSSGYPYAPYAPTSAIDFDLLAYSDYLYFEVQAVRGAARTVYPGVHVFLERLVSAGPPEVWTVDDDAITDADGYVDLFSDTPGDFRLRYQVGGVDVAVQYAKPSCGCTLYTLDEGGKKALLGSWTMSAPGDGYYEGDDIELGFAAPAGGGGGGTPAGPRSHPRAPGPTGFVLPTATPTPTPTPTSAP